jgi:hypothetical protein
MTTKGRKVKEEKVCNLCHRRLPRSDFYTQKTGAGTVVLRSRCKDCYRAVTRDYYQLNREELLQRQRQQYKKRRSYLLNYYRTHRDARLKYQREWYRKRKMALAQAIEGAEGNVSKTTSSRALAQKIPAKRGRKRVS